MKLKAMNESIMTKSKRYGLLENLYVSLKFPSHRNKDEAVNQLEVPLMSPFFPWCQENLAELTHADSRGMMQQTEIILGAPE